MSPLKGLTTPFPYGQYKMKLVYLMLDKLEQANTPHLTYKGLILVGIWYV